MPDHKTEADPKTDLDQSDDLLSLAKKTESSTLAPVPPLDNWNALQSVFGIANSEISDTPDSVVTCNPGSFSNSGKEDTPTIVSPVTPLNPDPTLVRTLEDAKRSAETARNSAQLAQSEAATAKKEAQTAFGAASLAKSQAEKAMQSAKHAQQGAEDAMQAAQQSHQSAETAKQAAQQSYQGAENAKQRAEAALGQLNAVLEKLKIHNPNPNDILKSHKLAFLLGALALIPLLFLLGRLLPLPPTPKPPSTSGSSGSASEIYVHPIYGKDSNNGSATAPVRSLSHALRQVAAGSTIYLAKGDYSTERSVAIPANTKLIIQPFNDINGHWAAPFVRALATQGLIAGYPDGSFKPDATLTRAQYATLLTRVFYLPEAPSVKKFADVSPDFWAYGAIQTVNAKNFLVGFEKNQFRPNDNVQRVQAISALVSGLGLIPTKSEETLKIYQDRNMIPGWADAKIATATAENLVINYPNLQMLNPTQVATRAETIVMIYQALVHQGKMPAIGSDYLVKR